MNSSPAWLVAARRGRPPWRRSVDDDSRLRTAVEDVLPLAAEHAAESDREGRLAPTVVKAVVQAGFARHFVPVEWGGHAGTFTDFTRAVTRLGIGCGAASWFASLAASLGRMAGYLPGAGQRRLWEAGGPDTLIVGSLMPAGVAERQADGWTLRGEWPFVSAVEMSDWALVCARAGSENRVFAVPRADYSVQRAWTSLGMRRPRATR
ncbi:hypothetical protein FXN61_19145 [Lentzea sp. PSKA42]|uniref:Acyl-CoA dehydrogenase/oxidase N-terminal domain-containing protein n=1 Tax=Lentzea indica TaxID=2604800 RepID=A0ABX1FJ18_9PSEU|nr:hypothetical protein [Lentzea indica]